MPAKISPDLASAGTFMEEVVGKLPVMESMGGVHGRADPFGHGVSRRVRKQILLVSGVVLSAGLSAGAVFLWTPLIFFALPLLLVVAAGIVLQWPQTQPSTVAPAGPVQRDTEKHQLEQVAARVHCFIWHAVVRETGSIGDEPISAPKRFKWQSSFVHGHPAQALRLSGNEDEPPLARWNRARHRDDRLRGDERFVEAIRRGDHELHQEYRIIDRDGQTLWIEESLVIQPAANGTWQVAGACLDVTKHKMADLARRESEQKLRSTLLHSHSLSFELEIDFPEGTDPANPDWSETRWHHLPIDRELLENLIPVDLPEGPTADFLEFAKLRHPDDAARISEVFLATARAGGREVSIEYRVRNRHGQYQWIAETSHLYRVSDLHYRLIGTLIDITLRKLAEEEASRATRRLLEQDQKLLQVLQDAHCLVFTGDTELPLDWRSQAHPDPSTFRWRMDALNGKAVLALVDVAVAPGRTVDYASLVDARVPEDSCRMSQVFLEAIHADRTSYSQEYRVRDRHGNVHWLAETIYLRPLSVNSWAFSGTTLDITQRKLAEIERQLAETELLKAKEEAEAANRAKDRFMAMLSHELRTPLTPVVAILSSLDADPRVPAELQQDISLMRRSVELEARLVDDLLDLTRIRHGKLHLNRRPVDGHEILRQTIGITNGPMDAKGISLRVNLLAQHATVHADSARLGQIFWNVLNNAVKFTPERGNITVNSSNTNGHLVIRISDTGKGVPPERLERIFTAFEQGSDESGPRQGGLGLGLTIARQLAQMHGATITASSEGPDRGSTFTISIPSIHAQVPVAQTPLEPAPAETPSLRILFVEDDPTTRTVLARLLRKAGHVVSTAASVRDGIDRANNGEFDLLVSDIGLPDGSGLDIMCQTKGRFALGGIALSGYGTDQDIQSSHAAGFRMHITKPVDITRLCAAIAEVAGVETPAGTAAK